MKSIIALVMIMISTLSHAGQKQNDNPLIKPIEVTSLTEQQKSAIDAFMKQRGLKQHKIVALVQWTKSDLEILNNLENIKSLNIQMPKFPVQWPVTQRNYQTIDNTLLWFGQLGSEVCIVTRNDDIIEIVVPWGVIRTVVDTDLAIFYNELLTE